MGYQIKDSVCTKQHLKQIGKERNVLNPVPKPLDLRIEEFVVWCFVLGWAFWLFFGGFSFFVPHRRLLELI